MFQDADRITIIGNGGGGKTTLAAHIGRVLDLPVFHLDHILWKPNWKPVSEADFRLQHHEIARKGRWIIEGLGYNSTFARRFERSDTIIFIDYSLFIHFYWTMKRSFGSISLKTKNNQLITKLPYILKLIWCAHRHTRGSIVELLTRPEAASKVCRVRNRRQLADIYAAIKDMEHAPTTPPEVQESVRSCC